jgi:alpha-beta hydrolase superfamily lysophospholipase
MTMIVVTFALLASTVIYLIHISTKLVIESYRRDWPAHEDFGDIAIEPFEFHAADGTRLRGDFFEVDDGRDLVAVIAHGRGGNRILAQRYAALFCHAGISAVTFDFRGYGESDGRHTTVAFKEQDDLLSVVQWVRTEKNFKRVIVLGISMGGAVAILSGSREGGIDGIISDCAFARFDEAMFNMGRRYGLSPMLSRLAIIGMRLRLGVRCEKIAPENEIGKIAPRPVLIIHGSDDSLIPLGDAKRLFANAGEPKELYVIEGVEHGRGVWDVPEDYEQVVLKFIKRHFYKERSSDNG